MMAYEKFEKALYRTVQKSDESTMSFSNRLQVAFDEVGDKVTLNEVRAFILLRQSNLSTDDKRKVIAMVNGSFEAKKVDVASKVLTGGDTGKKKVYTVYPVNYVDDDPEQVNVAYEEGSQRDEEELFQQLVQEGDESALLVQEFEDQVVDVVQDSPDLAMAFSAYHEARAKIRDRLRFRGFWPVKGKGGKGWSATSTSSATATSKGKGKSGGKRASAERIASSHGRLCGQRGHWKRECPKRNESGNHSETNLVYSFETENNAQNQEADEALVTELPPHDILRFQG